jgi:hypothetical protein
MVSDRQGTSWGGDGDFRDAGVEDEDDGAGRGEPTPRNRASRRCRASTAAAAEPAATASRSPRSSSDLLVGDGVFGETPIWTVLPIPISIRRQV